jgi:hypothetical protein
VSSRINGLSAPIWFLKGVLGVPSGVVDNKRRSQYLRSRENCWRSVRTDNSHQKSQQKNYQANIERDFVHSTLHSRFWCADYSARWSCFISNCAVLATPTSAIAKRCRCFTRRAEHAWALCAMCPSCQCAAVDLAPKSTATSARPVPTRGALRDRHERWERDAVDADVPKDERRVCVRQSRVVLAPRRWRQVLEKQASQGRWWQESPVTRESPV